MMLVPIVISFSIGYYMVVAADRLQKKTLLRVCTPECALYWWAEQWEALPKPLTTGDTSHLMTRL